jgi:hypothetical protein
MRVPVRIWIGMQVCMRIRMWIPVPVRNRRPRTMEIGPRIRSGLARCPIESGRLRGDVRQRSSLLVPLAGITRIRRRPSRVDRHLSIRCRTTARRGIPADDCGDPAPPVHQTLPDGGDPPVLGRAMRGGQMPLQQGGMTSGRAQEDQRVHCEQRDATPHRVPRSIKLEPSLWSHLASHFGSG